MKSLTENFRLAAWDYLYLLDRKYPQKAILKIIGDRYLLSGTERSMLYRGIAASQTATTRIKRFAGLADLSGSELVIDGFNVLITIGSYLNGNAVFISNDGILRDASEIHGKVFRSALLDRSLELLNDFLFSIKPSTIVFYLDEPVAHSGDLCHQINLLLASKSIPGVAKTCHSADYHLKICRSGILATSDSAVIDKAQVMLFDLPKHLIEHFYKPDFLDLREFIGKQ